MCLFVDFPLNKNETDCYLSKTLNFEYWANFIFCIFNTWVHITRFVKLPNPNKDTMLRQALQWKRDGVCHCIKSRQDISSLIDKGTKVGASYYRETLLQRCLLAEIRQTSGDHLVFQQDSAPSYQAKSTVEFVQRRVTNFTEPSVWPPNSPDLNPVDQAVWGALQQSVYCIPISDSDDLKNRVRTCWENLDQQIIDKSVDQWRDRLKAVVLVNAVVYWGVYQPPGFFDSVYSPQWS